MRALKFITGRVIFKLRYNQIYQLKTTHLNVLFNCIKCIKMRFLLQNWFQPNVRQ